MNRPRNTEAVVDPSIAQWFVRTMTRLWATFAIVAGMAILLSDSHRFASVSYRVALQVPGAPTSWGVAILLAGVLMLGGSLVAKPRVIGIGAFIGAIWALMFTWAFTVAATRYHEAGTIAPAVYLTLVVVFGLIAGIHLAMHPIKVPRRRHRKA